MVATLKLQLKSWRMVPSKPGLDVGKLKDERVAEEFTNRLSGDLGGLGAFGNPEELLSDFKTTILDVACGCHGTYRRMKNNVFLLKGHWTPLARDAGPSSMAELSCSGS